MASAPLLLFWDFPSQARSGHSPESHAGEANHLHPHMQRRLAAEEASIPFVTFVDISVGLLPGVKYEPV